MQQLSANRAGVADGTRDLRKVKQMVRAKKLTGVEKKDFNSHPKRLFEAYLGENKDGTVKLAKGTAGG